MKKFTPWLLFLICMVAASAQTTTITAVNIAQFGGARVTGTFCLSPTNGSGQPINITTPSGQQFSPQTPLCFPIVAGVLSSYAIVPDTALTQPVNACYALTVYNNFNQPIGTYPCLQPTGTTWSFDAYVPSTLPSIPALTLPQFQTNGVVNSLQGVQNLVAGPNISLNYLAGSVTIASTAAATAVGSLVFEQIKLPLGRVILLVPNNPIVME